MKKPIYKFFPLMVLVVMVAIKNFITSDSVATILYLILILISIPYVIQSLNNPNAKQTKKQRLILFGIALSVSIVLFLISFI